MPDYPVKIFKLETSVLQVLPQTSSTVILGSYTLALSTHLHLP